MKKYRQLQPDNKHVPDSLLSLMSFDTKETGGDENVIVLKLFNGRNEQTGLYCTIQKKSSIDVFGFLQWVYETGQREAIDSNLLPLRQDELDQQIKLLSTVTPSQRACDGLNELTARRKSNQKK